MKESMTTVFRKRSVMQSHRRSIGMIGSRNSITTSKTRDVEKRQSRQVMKFIDPITGQDLTPLPLLCDDKKNKEEKDFGALQSSSAAQLTNPFTFTKTLRSGSSPFTDLDSGDSEDEKILTGYSDMKQVDTVPIQVTIDNVKDGMVNIVVAETETLWIFDQPPKFVSYDTDDAAIQQSKRNSVYKMILETRPGNDRFIERGMNTFNQPLISKSTQTKPINLDEKGVMATVWDMTDTYALFEGQNEDDTDLYSFSSRRSFTTRPRLFRHVSPTSPDASVDPDNTNDDTATDGVGGKKRRGTLTDAVGTISPSTLSIYLVSLRRPDAMLDKPETVTGSTSGSSALAKASSNRATNQIAGTIDLENNPKLLTSLLKMERAVNLNTYFDKLSLYYEDQLAVAMNSPPLERSDTEATSSAGRSAGIPAIPTSMADDQSVAHDRTQTQQRSTVKGQPHSMSRNQQHQSAAHDAHSIASGSMAAGAKARRHSAAHLITVKTNSGGGVDQAQPAQAPPPTSSTPTKTPDIQVLWRFQCQPTKGRTIVDMAWNKENSTLLAVGYGQQEFENQRPGLVCVWSIKCIEYPERLYHTPSGVTAVSWSKVHSNLLAVGMFSGVIMVFDVRKSTSTPVIDTTYAIGRHFGVVRKLHWVVSETGRSDQLSEVLVSVSMDGRVTQWFVRRGFDGTNDTDYHKDLMFLKRTYLGGGGNNASATGGGGKPKRSENLIARGAVGTSLAFNWKDPSIYIVGTESGPIHKCSCTYNEQYLDTFLGHSASVLELEWSPFVAEVFFSCSADWTVNLWHVDYQKALLSIRSGVNCAVSISWSPHNSLALVTANESLLEVWNLDNSTVDPLVVETVTSDSNMTCVLYSEVSDAVVIGDNQGTLHAYKLVDFPAPPSDSSQQVAALQAILENCLTERKP